MPVPKVNSAHDVSLAKRHDQAQTPLFESLIKRYQSAADRRKHWENHWQECYHYALPRNDQAGAIGQSGQGAPKTNHIFDGTAPDAVEQLAASLMAELTPPFSKWFELSPGNKLDKAQAAATAEALRDINRVIEGHFRRSNFSVEIHQCYLDLITIGTASLVCEETNIGSPSAFRFTAVPMSQAILEEDEQGRLTASYRLHHLSLEALTQKFGMKALSDLDLDLQKTDGQDSHQILEIVLPAPKQSNLENGFDYYTLYVGQGLEPNLKQSHILDKGHFKTSPFINFRWLKVPGETYGRSPVMKALPDIKTANKVVELILKNASIAVTGLWQAEDDGVLNPATVKLVPGAIIPKAPGSAGLTPLQSPGQFDVSQLVLEDVRGRIRHALMIDRLGAVQGQQMTATEVMERASEMYRLLGASYGRLQAEFMLPLAKRTIAILQKRGEIPDFDINGDEVDITILAPIAQSQRQQETQAFMRWLEIAGAMGPEATGIMDLSKASRWLADSLKVPNELMLNAEEIEAAKQAQQAQKASPDMMGALNHIGDK